MSTEPKGSPRSGSWLGTSGHAGVSGVAGVLSGPEAIDRSRGELAGPVHGRPLPRCFACWAVDDDNGVCIAGSLRRSNPAPKVRTGRKAFTL